MNGFVVVNPEVLIARVLERGGRAAPGLDFIRWRLDQVRAEVQGASMVWTRFHRDIARVRAAQLAEARDPSRSVTVVTARLLSSEDLISPCAAKVWSR